MRKPRVLEVREKVKTHHAKKPKVVEEKDYSMLLERREPENVLLGKHEKGEIVDSARDKLREDMLADITPVRPPLPEGDLRKEIDEDQRKRHHPVRKIKKFMGLE